MICIGQPRGDDVLHTYICKIIESKFVENMNHRTVRPLKNLVYFPLESNRFDGKDTMVKFMRVK